jgi:hypothetical protein
VTSRLAAGLLLLALARAAAALDAAAPLHTVFLAGAAYQVELASDPRARERGLMGRSDIPPRGGMLFVFPDDAPRAFWMKNCLVDIDVAFLDARGRVVATHRMRAEPPQAGGESDAAYEGRLRHYPSGAPARFALELRAGSLARLGLGPGDEVDLNGVPLAPR